MGNFPKFMSICCLLKSPLIQSSRLQNDFQSFQFHILFEIRCKLRVFTAVVLYIYLDRVSVPSPIAFDILMDTMARDRVHMYLFFV